jgi:hypothetical protein
MARPSDSTVSVVIRLWAVQSDNRVLFQMENKICLSPLKRPDRPRIAGSGSPKVKRPGHKPDQSPSSSAEVKDAWSYTSTSPIRFHGLDRN